jgi:hypothetical protein
MLLRKIKETKIEAANHDEAFHELDGALVSKRSIVEEWKIEVEKWEDNPNDTSVRNPFITRVASKWSLHHDVCCFILNGAYAEMTLTTARLRLVQLEARELQQGHDTSLHPDISPSSLISLGLDLEEAQ